MEPAVREFVINKPNPEDLPKPLFNNEDRITNPVQPKSSNIVPVNESKLDHDAAFEKANERKMKLKGYSLKLTNINDLENEPAYKRKNVQFDNVPPSNESNISRYTLGEDKDGKVTLRDNNSFLHDQVD